MRPTGTEWCDPFDRHAAGYAEGWGRDSVARVQREIVRGWFDRLVPPGGAVLDAGCGPGLDTAWLDETGRRVVAVDASAGMVEQARLRAPGAVVQRLPLEDVGSLAGAHRFDAVLMNFGVVNCLDLAPVVRGLASCVREGGVLLVVPMGRFPPSWLLGQLLGLHLRSAFRRCRREVDVDVEGAAVRVRYLSGVTVARSFSPWFALEHQEGMGFLMPPPGTGWSEPWIRRLSRLEAPFRARPGFREIGDHLLVVLRRTRVPSD